MRASNRWQAWGSVITLCAIFGLQAQGCSDDTDANPNNVCSDVSQCNDANSCTLDECKPADSVTSSEPDRCTHTPIDGCGVVTGTVTGTGAGSSTGGGGAGGGGAPGCDMDDDCEMPDEDCSCADCATQPQCLNPGCPVISLAQAVNMFNEGDLEQIGDPASLDILQIFLANGLPPGDYEVSAPADHDDCFGPMSCIQVRQDFGTDPKEFIATSGTFTVASGPPYDGLLTGLLFEAYTQDANGLIVFGDPLDCLFLEAAPY